MALASNSGALLWENRVIGVPRQLACIDTPRGPAFVVLSIATQVQRSFFTVFDQQGVPIGQAWTIEGYGRTVVTLDANVDGWEDLATIIVEEPTAAAGLLGNRVEVFDGRFLTTPAGATIPAVGPPMLLWRHVMTDWPMNRDSLSVAHLDAEPGEDLVALETFGRIRGLAGKTGTLLWTHEEEDFANVVTVGHGGGVFEGGADRVWSMDPRTGALRGSYSTAAGGNYRIVPHAQGLAVTGYGTLSLVSEELDEQWSADWRQFGHQARVLRTGDVHPNPGIEIALAALSGHVYLPASVVLFSAEGSLLGAFATLTAPEEILMVPDGPAGGHALVIGSVGGEIARVS